MTTDINIYPKMKTKIKQDKYEQENIKDLLKLNKNAQDLKQSPNFIKQFVLEGYIVP